MIALAGAVAMGCGTEEAGSAATNGTGATGGSGTGGSGTGGSGTGGSVGPPGVEVPMACRNSFNQALSDIPIVLDVVPTSTIVGGTEFTADITPVLSFTKAFLDAALESLPSLTSVLVADAKATVQVFGATGANVVTNAPGTPCVVMPGNPNDCPEVTLNLCNGTNGCDATTPPTVATPLFVPLDMVQGSYTAGASGGEVCFDSFGTIPPEVSAATSPTDTYLRVLALTAIAVVIACEPGTVNDNGTPEIDPDDTVDPNTDADRVCFPIE
jgi:hypothetical protein